MAKCSLCGNAVSIKLELGAQPICNRFVTKKSDQEYMYPLTLGQCESCNLIQSVDAVPASELLPKFDWITYNEPEEHLNDLIDSICDLAGITKNSRVCGVSYKDDSLIKGLDNIGFTNTRRLDMFEDLGIDSSAAGAETIQGRLTIGIVDKYIEKYGKFDLIIARHIFEHAHEPAKFVEALKHLAAPGGYILLEVPDCTRALETNDYTTLWEEHTIYFTAETFRQSFSNQNLNLTFFKCFPYPFESSLVGIAQHQEISGTFHLDEKISETERKRLTSFADDLPKTRLRLKEFFSNFRRDRGGIALLGAGHIACVFINLLELKDEIEFVVDDNPNKHCLLMPGSKIPILKTADLLQNNIKLCLLSISPQAEEKVINNNASFVAGGGVFASIIPSSKFALDILKEG